MSTALKIFLAICYCLSSFAQADVHASSVRLPEDAALHELFSKSEYLEDAGRALSVEQVRAMPRTRFTPITKNNFSRGFSASAFWVHISVLNSDPRPFAWVLEHRLPLTDRAEFFVYEDGVLRATAIGGDRTKLSERQLAYRHPSLKHTTPAGKQSEVYVRISNRHAADVQLVFRLESEEAFVNHVIGEESLLGLFYGVPLALALSALIGGLVSKDWRFTTYSLYAFFTLAAWIGFDGQFATYTGFDYPDFWNAALQVFFLLQSIFAFIFARDFLSARTVMPRFDAVFRVLIYIAAVGIALRFAGVYTAVAQLSVAIVALTALTTVAAWQALRAGVVYARWYLVAQLFSTVPVAIGIIGARIGIFTYDGFVHFQYVYFGELLLLAVAQHDRVRILEVTKQALERDYRTALEEKTHTLEREALERNKRLIEAQARTAFLSEVQQVTARVAGGEFGARLVAGDNAGMQELTVSVNAMAASLERLEGARRRWIAETSHELRTPLTVLIAETEALLDGVRTLDKPAIASLHATAAGLTRLVDDLHDIATSYLKPLSCKLAPVDLHVVLMDLLPHFEGEAERKGLALRVTSDTRGCQGMWDAGRINQLLINLLHNSINYTDAPGCVEIAIGVEAQRALILIDDSAPGLREQELEQAFEPLYRADEARSRRTGGSGLGLAICKAIVEAHHGKIAARHSRLGGVQMRVELPFSPRGQ